MIAAIRSIFYYPVFYGISALLVLISVLSIPFGRDALRRAVANWSGWHRWCVVHLLGAKVRIEGEIPKHPVLFAIKHESFFEAIDAPTLLEFPAVFRSEEHTSELQSLMRISYAVFCLKKKITQNYV